MTLGWDSHEQDKKDIVARSAEIFGLARPACSEVCKQRSTSLGGHDDACPSGLWLKASKRQVASIGLSAPSLFTLKTMVRVIIGQELRSPKPDPEVFESVEQLCYETGLDYKELSKQAALGTVG